MLLDYKHTTQHDWMAFAFCYSMYKNLPDAKIILRCERVTDMFFRWSDKFGVKVLHYLKTDKLPQCEANLVFPPHVMAVRPYMAEAIGPADAKSNEFTTFASYDGGCGGFVFEEGSEVYPLRRATRRFVGEGISSTEFKILKMWEQVDILYTMVGG